MTDTTNKLYTLAEVAAILGVNSDTIKAKAWRYGIGEKRSGRLKLYSEADIERFRSLPSTAGRPSDDAPYNLATQPHKRKEKPPTE